MTLLPRLVNPQVPVQKSRKERVRIKLQESSLETALVTSLKMVKVSSRELIIQM